MEKLALSTDGDQVAQHFGRCEKYTLVEVNDGEIVNKEIIANPGHEPGFLPKYLNEQGVDVILAGGMGRKAKDLFDQNEIKAVIGVNGLVDDAVKSYLAGELKSEGEVCEH
ncbi:MAG: NifB/NifX family molybdenum-iron cluster-binding protein [Halanaerobium sp.]